MSDYEINQKDIESVIRHLKINDPDNADEEYATELLHSMNDVAKELVDQDMDFAELMREALKRKNV